MKLRDALIGIALGAAAFTGCDDPTPDAFSGDPTAVDGETSYFEKLSSLTVAPAGVQARPGVLTPAALEAKVLALIDTAELKVELALAHMTSEAVAEALIRKAEAGVEIRVAADADAADEAGFVALEAGGIEVVYGDGAQFWSPQPGIEVDRGGDANRMTHGFILVDKYRFISITGGLLGPDSTAWQIGAQGRGEILGRDMGHSLNQLLGGTFSTSLTVFGAPLSADGNFRTFYPIEDGVVEWSIGPQEPLTKELIDRIYGARASIWLAAERFSNPRLFEALAYKAAAGFEVQVVLSPKAAEEAWPVDGTCEDTADACCAIDPETGESASDCVEVSRAGDLSRVFQAIVSEGGRPAYDGRTVRPSLAVRDGVMGTTLIIDAEPSPKNGLKYPGQAMISSQPLAPTVAFGRDLAAELVYALPSDFFTDGNMLVLHESLVQRQSDYEAAVGWFLSMLEAP